MWGVVRYCGDMISLYKSVSTSKKEAREKVALVHIESFEQMSSCKQQLLAKDTDLHSKMR